MRALEQAKPAETSAHAGAQSGFHAELSSIWGPPPAFIKQTGEFLSGVGEGFGQACNEGARTVAQAVSNPGEALHKAADETVKTVKGACDTTVAASHYVADKVSHGDVNGVVHDAQKTAQVVGHVVSEGVNHLSHMNAHDLGKVVGHDVLPGAIAAVVVPELAGEGIALAASAASKLGTLAKDAEVLNKVAGVYESAASKISAISEKMAGLNKKMESLQREVRCTTHLDGEGFEHLKPTRHEKSPVSDSFCSRVEEAQKSLEARLANHLKGENIKVHVVEKLEHVFDGDYARVPACFNPMTTDEAEEGIYIAEKVWHRGDWIPNPDLLHNFHHEVGHAINATLKTDWLSNDKAFREVFDAVWKTIDMNHSTVKILLTKGSQEAIRDEVFADLWGHLAARSVSSNAYSNGMLELFGPVFEYMQGKKVW